MLSQFASQSANWLPGVQQAVAVAASRSLQTSTTHLAGFFSHVEQAPRDPILGITEKYLACQVPEKINLGVGAYRDDDGQPVVLYAVREAERRVSGSHFMEYLPIGGLKEFNNYSIRLALGENAACIAENRVAAVQSLSGTGSCRLMAEIQKRYMPNSTVYIPTPTWSNHHNIWRDAGVNQAQFRYYNPETKGLDFEGMMDDIKAAPNGSTLLLHACAHNPTGVDPTEEQWRELSKLALEKNHFCFFDMAYQGFASGNCERDAVAIRIFLDDGHMLGCSQSYAKNMGMYGQRVGCFSIVCPTASEASALESQMRAVARPMYSNPPIHGALLVSTILGDAALKEQWFGEVKGMADRIIRMRTLLKQNLHELGSQLSWEHITDQIGMFCFSGLTPEMVDALATDSSIFMTRNGRISMAGVTSKNVRRLAEAMHSVTK